MKNITDVTGGKPIAVRSQSVGSKYVFYIYRGIEDTEMFDA
jgi:hypothetical protein